MHDARGEDATAWRRLGDLLLARRVELGFPKRAAFARHLGLSHDRTLSDIELARRRNFDRTTLLFIERSYGWENGSIAAVLAGGEPSVTEQNPGRSPEVDRSSVGGGQEGREPYLSRRTGPDLTDVTTDALLEELARRARANNPDATR